MLMRKVSGRFSFEVRWVMMAFSRRLASVTRCGLGLPEVTVRLAAISSAMLFRYSVSIYIY